VPAVGIDGTLTQTVADEEAVYASTQYGMRVVPSEEVNLKSLKLEFM
jgi:hypothetical protein